MSVNTILEPYKNVTKISIIDCRKVFYPVRYSLQGRDIKFDEKNALVINLLPEDIDYPGSYKDSDAGTLMEYRIKVTVPNQSGLTNSQLIRFLNRKIIAVLHYPEGRMIIGCNEFPLGFTFTDDSTSNPAQFSGYTIQCRGNTYFPKVIR